MSPVGVQPEHGLGAVTSHSAGVSGLEEFYVETSGVVITEVLLDQGDQVGVMSPVGIEPEHSLGTSGLSAGDSELDPVLDGNVLDLAHPPDVSSLHCVLENLVTSAVSNGDCALGGNLEGLVVAAILLSLLGHQADVGNVTSGGVVKLSLLLAVLNDGVVDTGVGPVGDDTLDLLELVVLVPHLSSITDDVGHGGVDDDIAGNVEVGDSGVGVDHGEAGPGLVLLHDVGLDLLLHSVALDFVVNIANSVVGVDLQLVE